MNVSWFIPSIPRWPWHRPYDFDRYPASVWIRCLQLLPYLNGLGVHSLINQSNSKTQIAVFLRRYDNESVELASYLRSKNVKVVLDTPVNYFTQEQHWGYRGNVRARFKNMAHQSDAILCPSIPIEECGKGMGFPVIRIEDSIDLDHFKFKKSIFLRHKSPTLIWAGHSSKAAVLNFLAPVFKRLLLKFIVISKKKPVLKFQYQFIRWSHKFFPQAILEGDLGIFPRPTDNDYDLGHSFFKIGAFLSERVPVLCSPVPSYLQIAHPSNSRIIPEMDASLWEQSLTEIISGKIKFTFEENRVVSDFSTHAAALRYLDLFSNLLEGDYEHPLERKLCANSR